MLIQRRIMMEKKVIKQQERYHDITGFGGGMEKAGV
jgi:hypothetical protein